MDDAAFISDVARNFTILVDAWRNRRTSTPIA
jgi:myo-inositol catabolism protein IolC